MGAALRITGLCIMRPDAPSRNPRSVLGPRITAHFYEYSVLCLKIYSLTPLQSTSKYPRQDSNLLPSA